ncbi:hypothetical protein BURMUCF1_2599, partial [Burkholderia multivorans ATCC BAA-247]
MGDGSTRRSSTPQRRQDEAHDARADGQFDLFGALPSPDDVHASSHDAADTDDARAHATRAPRAPKPARPSAASDAGNAARDDEAAAPPSTGML